LYKALVEFESIGIMEMCRQTFSELGVLGAVIVTGHSGDFPGNKREDRKLVKLNAINSLYTERGVIPGR